MRTEREHELREREREKWIRNGRETTFLKEIKEDINFKTK